MSTSSPNPTAAFVAYAEAFETGYALRDWKPVDELVTDDVVWSLENMPPPLGGTHVGRTNVIAAIRDSTEHFDRRFDRREPRILEGPREIPGGIHMTWEVTYSRDGLEPFVLRGEEWDLFRDGRLSLHRENIHNMDEALAYLGRHADALLPVAS
jgi:ketosteroid isomerase-like protein